MNFLNLKWNNIFLIFLFFFSSKKVIAAMDESILKEGKFQTIFFDGEILKSNEDLKKNIMRLFELNLEKFNLNIEEKNLCTRQKITLIILRFIKNFRYIEQERPELKNQLTELKELISDNVFQYLMLYSKNKKIMNFTVQLNNSFTVVNLEFLKHCLSDDMNSKDSKISSFLQKLPEKDISEIKYYYSSSFFESFFFLQNHFINSFKACLICICNLIILSKFYCIFEKENELEAEKEILKQQISKKIEMLQRGYNILRKIDTKNEQEVELLFLKDNKDYFEFLKILFNNSDDGECVDKIFKNFENFSLIYPVFSNLCYYLHENKFKFKFICSEQDNRDMYLEILFRGFPSSIAKLKISDKFLENSGCPDKLKKDEEYKKIFEVYFEMIKTNDCPEVLNYPKNFIYKLSNDIEIFLSGILTVSSLPDTIFNAFENDVNKIFINNLNKIINSYKFIIIIAKHIIYTQNLDSLFGIYRDTITHYSTEYVIDTSDFQKILEYFRNLNLDYMSINSTSKDFINYISTISNDDMNKILPPQLLRCFRIVNSIREYYGSNNSKDYTHSYQDPTLSSGSCVSSISSKSYENKDGCSFEEKKTSSKLEKELVDGDISQAMSCVNQVSQFSYCSFAKLDFYFNDSSLKIFHYDFKLGCKIVHDSNMEDNFFLCPSIQVAKQDKNFIFEFDYYCNSKKFVASVCVKLFFNIYFYISSRVNLKKNHDLEFIVGILSSIIDTRIVDITLAGGCRYY